MGLIKKNETLLTRDRSLVNQVFRVVAMSEMAKAVSVVGFVLIMIVVSRSLYLLTSLDSQGFSEDYGIWVTIGTVVIACIAGGIMFYLFLRQGSAAPSEAIASSIQPATHSPGGDIPHKLDVFDVTAWERQNPWLTGGQADDRMPMLGSAGNGNDSSSGRRSAARRTHQMMYKKWSQARHD